MTKHEATARLLRAASFIEAHLRAHEAQFSASASCFPVAMLEAASLEIRAVLSRGGA